MADTIDEGSEKLDLWPDDIGPADIITPTGILKEQASQLGKKTRLRLRGAVETVNKYGTLYHTFYIVAPTLHDYRYELLQIHHDAIPYPVYLDSGPRPEGVYKLDTEEEFVEWLKWVFGQEDTRRVIGALLAQVKA